MAASQLYYYKPSTPPSSLTGDYLAGTTQSRATSGSSVYASDSSPGSAITNITTPNRSPGYRQHGPTLLPKIRPQDIVVEPATQTGPYRHRKSASGNIYSPGYAPYPAARSSIQRRVIDPSDCSLVSPISSTPIAPSYPGSTLASPVTAALPPQSRKRHCGNHSRSSSGSSLDAVALGHYGYPTYRQVPKYISQCSPSAPVSPAGYAYQPSYQPSYQALTQQYGAGPQIAASQGNIYQHPVPTPRTLGPPMPTSPTEVPPSTTLLEYLTEPIQAVNLVQAIVYPSSRINQTHFWWDIRNLRQWTSFSLPAINTIPGLTKLLTTQVPQDLTPPTSVPHYRLSPESEPALADLVRDVYAPRINAALRISQGRDCLSLYPAPISSSNRDNEPHFLANYPTDTEQTSSGLPRGRVVGIIKSFDRWNTGMRNEQPHRRVEYLSGLAHLQRCMREHSCRYGFIMTEIELVCVRAGCDEGDDVPYFGYLELATPIATKASSATFVPMTNSIGLSRTHSNQSDQSSDYSSSSRGGSPAYPYQSSSSDLSGSMTATLGLYYLLMLSKAVPLPSQPAWHLNVGGPGAMTRQRILSEGKDRWIPEPQQRERREARRARGWIWPQDAWHRREGGGSNRSKAAKAAAAKRWHK